VVRELFEKIAVSYPILRESFQEVACSILEASENESLRLLEGLILREKDPFTINEFLQAHINKLRYDRFETSVDDAFRGTILDISGSGSWQAAKEHVGASLRSWYRSAHGVSTSANAEDMSAILEAYWTLASKRFVDNACMCLDDRILGTLCGKVQEACYQFVHDEARLQAFFTEDEAIVARRVQLEQTRDHLMKANAAMSSIQVTRKHVPRAVNESLRLVISVAAGCEGLGLQLGDEAGQVVTRGFRANSTARRAGMKVGDILLEINGVPCGSFPSAIAKLKAAKLAETWLKILRKSG
jgi:interferon-induced GTP-binding protein Mx1